MLRYILAILVGIVLGAIYILPLQALLILGAFIVMAILAIAFTYYAFEKIYG